MPTDYKPPCEVDRFKAREIDPESLDGYDMRNLARAFRCEMDSRRNAETRVAKLEETIRASDKQTVRLTIEQVERQRHITELEAKVKRMAPYMPAPAAGESRTDWLDLANERIEELEKALRESCDDWHKMHNASLQAAAPRFNLRMLVRIAAWKKLCGWKEES